MLTKRQLEIMQQMADAEDRDELEDMEIVSEGIECWLGDHRTSWKTLQALIDHTVVSCDDLGGVLRRWTLNGCGRMILKHPEKSDELWLRLRTGKPFTVNDDGFEDM